MNPALLKAYSSGPLGKRQVLEPIYSGFLVSSESAPKELPPKELPPTMETPPDNAFRPKILRTNHALQNLLTTLLVLISLPSLVVSADFILNRVEENEFLCRLCVLFFAACLIVGVSHVPVKFGLVEKRLFPESWTVVAGLVLFFLSPMALSYTRIAVVYFGLFLNGWNLYTPLALFSDVVILLQSAQKPYVELSGTVAAYTAIIALHCLIQRALKARRGASASQTAVAVAMLAVGTAGSAALALFYNFLNPIFFSIALAVSAVLLVLFNWSRQLSRSDIFVVGLFLFVFEHYILRVSPASARGAFLSILLPLVVDPLPQTFAETDEIDSPQEKPRVLQKILAHSDTRGIFNFLLLNITFMFIQLVYSFRSKSLGLLSDSLHMALDCASLALGLVAGTLLKQEVDINSKFPFGLRNFEILAGFANGTLLIGISGSIIFEAVGRLNNPVELKQTTELIIVSTLGLLVNIVGIFAFNHCHGHSHGHSKSHDQGKDAPEKESHSHTHTHSHSHTHSHGSDSPEGCDGMNDNMRGIFLHILADTLGSVAVVVSTILIKVFKWQGFDPVASIAIAGLIFVAAGPLMSSTASTLLLKLDCKKEAVIRSCLNDLTAIRGVSSFSTPRFWAKEGGLTGYIHVQVYRGESISSLRTQCKQVFKAHNVDAMVQMEKDYDSCWCR